MYGSVEHPSVTMKSPGRSSAFVPSTVTVDVSTAVILTEMYSCIAASQFQRFGCAGGHWKVAVARLSAGTVVAASVVDTHDGTPTHSFLSEGTTPSVR